MNKKTRNGIIAVSLVGFVVFLVYKKIKKQEEERTRKAAQYAADLAVDVLQDIQLPQSNTK